MEILAHEHPLTLIDLNPKYPHEKEVYDDEEDLIAKQAFQHRCHRSSKSVVESSILLFPLSDGTYNTIIKEFIFKETTNNSNTEMMRLIDHNSLHPHPLILVDTNTTTVDQDLCNGCVTPIKDLPYYKCITSGCNFLLHAFCTRLPAELKFGHDHTLTLLPKVPGNSFGLFKCSSCETPCDGFAYSCVNCHYIIDVSCAFLPFKIKHRSHPNHILRRSRYMRRGDYCGMCSSGITYGDSISYSCSVCNFYLHLECALLLPKTITPKYDKHPMTLTCGPVEDHGGDYFCEVCEEELNPYMPFYHCHKCGQSIHSANCAPVIVPPDPAQGKSFVIRGPGECSDDYYANVKGGSIYKTEDHPHPLLILKWTEDKHWCSKCAQYLWPVGFILKCLECKYAIHLTCLK
ncbi:hypothetical protein SSX86_021322 [Deinandra increscens subsp. villosa]|uniref:Phorbol-ester/DAG-type domain-containing protein n=1 Tax=Deinandra increscens subsp. villosa TaxID=3103831 RepID=A0AAP0GT02_9ASTR